MTTKDGADRLADALRSAINEAVASRIATLAPAPSGEPGADDRLQVTVAEAARLLSYDESTIRRLITRGSLEAVGHGRGTRIPMASLRGFIEDNKRPRR